MVSVRRVAPVLLLVVALPLAAATHAKKSSRPPRDLHRVGDHWTAYNPPDPSTYAPGAKTHVIAAGETLWGIGQQLYGSAYLWPQILETNTWITDAHWIYPGDVLLLQGEPPAETTVATTPQPEPAAAEQAPAAPTAAMTPASTPIPIATEADLYCYGYIGDPAEPMPNQLESFEDIEVMHQVGVEEQAMSASTGDLVFVRGGTSTGIVAGDTYLLIEPGAMVVHPATGKTLGRQYDFVGQLKILCADADHSRAMITQSCREVHIGARLKPLPQLPIPIARVPDLAGVCDPPSARSNGFIVSSRDWDLALGEGDLVQIDLGRDEQLQPGDFMTIFRDSPVEHQPRVVLGELGILTTEAHTATARVISVRRTIHIGDRVEMR